MSLNTRLVIMLSRARTGAEAVNAPAVPGLAAPGVAAATNATERLALRGAS